MCGFNNSQEMDEISDTMKEKIPTSTRRNNKPLMEKRRRQRINDCLNQLKSLVLQAMNKDTTQYSKLEKADILEMTVKHLKMVQRQQMTAAVAADPNVISKYRAGYNECAAEVARYLDTVNGGSHDLKGRLMGYLGNTMMQFPVIPVYQGMMVPHQVQINQVNQMTAQRGFPSKYNQDNLIRESPNPVSFTSAQNYSQISPPLNRSQHLGHVPTSPHSVMTSHQVSPTSRHVPSPSDSDSGLSDRSSPLSHDENGNYSVFNINHPFTNAHAMKTEHSAHFVSPKVKSEPGHTHSQVLNRNPKRKCDFIDDVTSSKRRHIGEQQSAESVIVQAGQIPESDNMWRPW